MTVKLLTEHHLEFLSLNGGCTGSSEPTLVKMLHCWKSHAVAHFFFCLSLFRLTKKEKQDLEYKKTVLRLAKEHRDAKDIEKVNRYYIPKDDAKPQDKYVEEDGPKGIFVHIIIEGLTLVVILPLNTPLFFFFLS